MRRSGMRTWILSLAGVVALVAATRWLASGMDNGAVAAVAIAVAGVVSWRVEI